MRLLRGVAGGFSLTEEFVSDDTIPPYAILSHTWEEDQEVTFQDLIDGTGQRKTGYEKILFSGHQAEHDGLHYFWIDTCCINKADPAELQKAINSMFHWYRSAAKCYVYLSDVSTIKRKASGKRSKPTWEPAFRASRWFTRGWTLQELLAPVSVDFFSREWKKIGNKSALKQKIHTITGVPESALQGEPLCQFSDKERFSWIQCRQTKVEEDKAYSLLGIFGVEMDLRYGEGSAGAFKRLEEEIDKMNKCLRDLRLTDPRDDKTRIEDTKGGLLEDSYRWVLENHEFQRWCNGDQDRLLWIKGDPGKGKTMLLCGITNELKRLTPMHLLSYFFCQATDSRINNATAVLRGLLYMLVVQQPLLIRHVRKKHDHAGKALFEDTNAWVALCEIFINLLKDPSFNNMFLIIDALDECVVDLRKLLDLIARTSSASSRIKWIVSSRNWPYIEEQLERAGNKVKLSLELNAKSISTAVSVFIQHKVRQLAERKKYDDETRNNVLAHLSSNANDTFLWVALVCQNLEKVPRYNTIKRLNAFLPGLDSIYERMMQKIGSSDDADACKEILAIVAILYRPVTLEELATLAEPLKYIDDEAMREFIGQCGSFLTLRANIVYFVHQSAKDFLLGNASNDIFPSGKEEVHRVLFIRSLQVMSVTLKRDIYNLREPGCLIDQVERPDPDPLRASRYSCIYWVDHLCDWNSISSAALVDIWGKGSIEKFLRQKFLYWLEALSLCKNISNGVVSIAKLEGLIHKQVDTAAILQLVQDARRFVMYHKGAIEHAPLQAYVSALAFSPRRSLVRSLFQGDAPAWLAIKPAVEDTWGACLQTLEGHTDRVSSVAFSHDSTRIASGSNDKTIRIWDASTGELLQTLKGHTDWVSSVAFSNDSTRIASVSDDKTIRIWDASTGDLLQTLIGHASSVNSVAFSHDSTRIASGSDDKTIRIWDASTGELLQTLKGHTEWVRSVAFSHDSTRIASGSNYGTIRIWDASTGELLQTLKGHTEWVMSVAFSHDSTRIASGSSDKTIRTWDASTGDLLQMLKGHTDWVRSVAFSHDSTWIASGSSDKTIRTWDASTGELLQTLKGHTNWVNSVAFSHDSTRIASGSNDETIRIWDASTGEHLKTLKVGRVLSVISFDLTGFYLHTNIGTIAISDSRTLNRTTATNKPHPQQPWNIVLNSDKTWITCNSKKVLWLPSEYRPWSSAVSGKTIAVGTGSGKVWICTLNLDEFPYLRT